MRFVIEFEQTGDGVVGSVHRDGLEAAEAFSGWLEVLARLEAPQPASEADEVT